MRTLICALLSMAVFATTASAGDSKSKRHRKLRHPEVTYFLTPTTGFTIRTPRRSFGTEITVKRFAEAVAAVRKKHGPSAKLPVGDLSYLGGGRMRPHRSHRDGRDIDVGYYFKDGEPRKWFKRARPESLDAARTWTLFKTMLDSGDLEYIFVDWRLQKALYHYALTQGETKKSLKTVFQYPRWRGQRTGVIRWERGHADHFHVRFKHSDESSTAHQDQPKE